MELGLRLGSEAISKTSESVGQVREDDHMINKKGSLLSFCMELPTSPNNNPRGKLKGGHKEGAYQEGEEEAIKAAKDINYISSVQEPKHHLLMESDHQSSPIQLIDLLPNTPVPRNHDHLNPCGKTDHQLEGSLNAANNNGNAIEAINMIPSKAERVDLDLDLDLEHHDQDGSSSPPNSGASSFQMDFSLCSNKLAISGINYEGDNQDNSYGRPRRAGSSRGSDEEENGSTRKKLRLSKEQSAFLEENFKEHSTLNPKQKLALAKQLNLRPRQVEVWFQNRRARTKLKQTELDCEYLKRCCETLTEENRRLHKELQELRALKTSNPFYKQPPATTLTMCPSCERVSSSTTNISNNSNNTKNNHNTNTNASLSNPNSVAPSKSRFDPFSLAQPNNQQTGS